MASGDDRRISARSCTDRLSASILKKTTLKSSILMLENILSASALKV